MKSFRKILALVLAVVTMFSLAAAAGAKNFEKINTYTPGQFADVPEDAWYATYVKQAYAYGLIKGTSQTSFNPDGKITLAETIALAARLHSTACGVAQAFVQGDVWYEVYVDYAEENGIIRDGAFADFNVPATRLQFAEIFAAAFSKEALPAINNIKPGQIPDVSKNDAVYLLYNAGVLTGSDEDGTFLPGTSIKRSEVAAIVTRMADESLRVRLRLDDEKEDDKELSAWEELTKDDETNFSTFLTICNGVNLYAEKAQDHMDALAEEPIPAASLLLCREYLSMCREYLVVLSLNCEKYDYLSEAKDLADLAVKVIEPFLNMPVPDTGDGYTDAYMDCVDSLCTITGYLNDEVDSLRTMFE